MYLTTATRSALRRKRGHMGYKTYTCPIARECGGCEWLAVPYPIQLKRKGAFVEELFKKMVEADGATLDDVRAMDDPRGYRHKAATPFAPGKARGRKDRNRQAQGHSGRGADARRGPSSRRILSGFYAAGTHRIVRTDECLVEAPQARAILNDVARVGERLDIRAYQEDRGRGMLRHAVVRVGWKTGEVLLTVVTNGQQLPRERAFVEALTKAHPEITTIVQNVNQRQTNAILGRESRVLFGPGMIRDELLGCTFEIGPTTFYQTNPEQTEVLYRLAIDGAALEDGSRVLDAYCGCGTIGICAASAARETGLDVSVTGIEQVEGAVRAARRNARANGLADACRFVAGDATEYMARLAGSSGGSGSSRSAGRSPARDGSQSDVVIMDPPRAGSTPEFLAGVLALAPRRVVYVSCNAVTQARDLKQLRAGGYRLERLAPVDMFPHTKHVETVAVLSRADG